MAASVELFQRQRDASIEAQNDAAELRLRAERRLGEVLAAMPKNAGSRGQLIGRGVIGDAERESPIAAPRLADIGVKPKQSMTWQQEAAIPEPVFEEYVAETRATRSPRTVVAVGGLCMAGLAGASYTSMIGVARYRGRVTCVGSTRSRPRVLMMRATPPATSRRPISHLP